MKIQAIAIAVAAVMASSAALAGAAASKSAEPPAAAQARTLLEEVTAGMRDILLTVTPEISLPAVEVKLPTLDARR